VAAVSALGKAFRREHLVAASLVGSVVVVLGFASGVGITPLGSGSGDSAAAPAPEHAHPTPSAVPPATTTEDTPEPGDTGSTGDLPVGDYRQPALTSPPGIPPSTSDTSGTTSTGTPTRTTITLPIPPPQECAPNLIGKLIGGLTDTLAGAVGGLPLVGGLVDVLPLHSVTGQQIGVLPTAVLAKLLTTCPAGTVIPAGTVLPGGAVLPADAILPAMLPGSGS
jgi:hypothetical protein